jgi:serine/threonine protein kinase
MSPAFRYQPGERLGGTFFRVERLLGVGGMSTVYEVTEVTCGRTYALKTLTAELRHRTDLRARFVAEGKLYGKLHGHPNIVEVISQGVTADDWELPFIVMEHLKGTNMRQVLAKRGCFPLDGAVEIMAQILDALEHAHEKGIVHRDVKPENIVLHRDAMGRPKPPKLIDFGIHEAPDARASSRMIGTPLYMAPELFGHAGGYTKALAPRVDLYAAAVTLYEAATGRTPFEDARSEEALIEAHTKKAPRPPSMFVSNMPVNLEDAILRGLEKDPRNRWPDAFTFANALRACLKSISSGRVPIDQDSRITAEVVPTHVGTPGEERASKTDPGEAPDGSPASRDGHPAIPETEPGVPMEILQMMIARAAGQENQTFPGTPQARRDPATNPSAMPRHATPEAFNTNRTQPIAAAPAPAARTTDVDHRAAFTPNEGRAPAAHRISALATHSRPGSPQVAAPAPERDRTTPAYPLPSVRQDPDAPEAIRTAVAAQPIVFVGKEEASGPDRVFMDEEDDDARGSDRAESSKPPPARRPPMDAPQPPRAPLPAVGIVAQSTARPRPWLQEYRELRAKFREADRSGRGSIVATPRQQALIRFSDALTVAAMVLLGGVLVLAVFYLVRAPLRAPSTTTSPSAEAR